MADLDLRGRHFGSKLSDPRQTLYDPMKFGGKTG